jgi:hypothetical protein
MFDINNLKEGKISLVLHLKGFSPSEWGGVMEQFTLW